MGYGIWDMGYYEIRDNVFSCIVIKRSVLSFVKTPISALFIASKKTYHSGHYGHFVNINHNGQTHYVPTYGQYWCLFEDKEKSRSVVKVKLKNMHQSKSNGQNKIN